MTTALGLAGVDTGAVDSYADAMAARPDLVALRDKVTVVPRADFDRLRTEMRVRLAGGREIAVSHDMDNWSLDVARQWDRLADKFRGLAIPVVGARRANEILAAVGVIERLDDSSELVRLCRPA
jgi:2-methylcitrate dehydratase PrpD